MISVKKYIESNKDRFIEELFSLIRIPSISAKHEHKPDMEACAKRWTELLLAAGADKAVVMQTEGNPVVYGEKMVSPEAQTVLGLPIGRSRSQVLTAICIPGISVVRVPTRSMCCVS